MSNDSKPKRTWRNPALLRWGAWGCLSLLVVMLVGVAAIIVPDFIRPLPEPPDGSALLDRLASSAAETKRSVPLSTAPRTVDRLTSPSSAESPAAAPITFETVLRSMRPIPDLTVIREDLRPVAAEWNGKSDALTSAALVLLSESRSLSYSEVTARMESLRQSYNADIIKYGRMLRFNVNSSDVPFGRAQFRYMMLTRIGYIRAATTPDDWLDAGKREITHSGMLSCWRKAGLKGYGMIACGSCGTWLNYRVAPITQALWQRRSLVHAWRRSRRSWQEYQVSVRRTEEFIKRNSEGLPN